MKQKVVIIGAGISGLASAIRMAAAGYEVEIFEKNPLPGGKLGEFRKKGYRFDMGPSLLTMPGLIHELFELTGEDTEKFIRFEKLDMSCRYFYADKTVISAFSDREMFLNEIRQKTTARKTDVEIFLDKAAELYTLTAKVFIFSPFQKLSTLMSAEAKAIARKLHLLDAFTTLHRRNKKSLKNEKLVQMFDRYATYNGSNPYKAPATLKIIAHLEHNTGSFLPAGGMFSIVNALLKLAQKLGITIQCNTPVDEIIVSERAVKGIKYNNTVTHADIVISDADIYSVYGKLLKNRKLPGRIRRQELSSSALIFYWGVKNSYPELDIHNILFSGNYREEFDTIFRKKTIYSDPTVYIYISSKLNPGDAPEACENWFVMINTPNNTGQDWERLREISRKYIVRKINKVLSTDIEKFIEVEEYLDPVKIETFTNSFRGALYGPSSNSKLSAFYRHANFSGKIKGLYFTGGSVHPGGGIPLCMASAKIVAHLITEDFLSE